MTGRSFLLALLLLAGTCQAAILKTDDGLTLTLNDDGAIAGLAAGERKLPVTAGGGFYLLDVEVATPDELLPNGGFEEAGEGEAPFAGWRVDSFAEAPGCRWLADTESGRPGRVARLEMPQKPAAAENSPGLNLAEPIAVRAGAEYRLTAWVKWQGTPDRAPGVYLVFRQADGKARQTGLYLWPAGPSSEWRRVSQVFVAEPSEMQATVYCNLYGAGGTAWIDDLSLVEVGQTPEQHRRYVRAPLVKQAGVLAQKQKLGDLGVEVETGCATSGGYLSFTGKVQDLQGRDRALEMGWEVPLAALGWNWADDIVNSRRVEPNLNYRSTWACDAGPGYNQVYPFSSLADGDTGLSLGVALAQGPRVYSVEYDAAHNRLLIRFHLGLTAQAKELPGQASFSFLLYRHDGAWGLRAAADRYYQFFPQDFEKRVLYEGHLGYAHLETRDSERGPREFYGIPAFGDFGCGFRWLWHQHTAYAAITCDTDEAAHPDDATVMKLLNDAAAAQGERKYGWGRETLEVLGKQREMTWEEPAWSLLRKLYTNAEGKIVWVGDSHYTPPQGDKPGQWLLNFQVNDDPDLSPTLKQSLEETLAAWQRDNPHVEPYTWTISNDGTGFTGRQLDFRAEHLAVADVPLTYDQLTKKPAISDPSWEFNSQVLAPLARQHQFLMHRNFVCGTPSVGANLPFVDIGLIECQYGAYGMGEDSDRYVRTSGYRKIFRYWFYPPQGETHDAAVRDMFHRGLVYAIYPHLVADAERFRDLYLEFVPVVEQLSSAGWEPVTLARSSDAQVRVERYGRLADANLAFACRNTADQRRRCRVILDQALGLGQTAAGLEARDLLTGRPVRVMEEGGRLALAVDLQGGESTAYTVLPGRQRLQADLSGAAETLRQAADLDPEEVSYQPSRPANFLQGDTPDQAQPLRILSDGWMNYQGLIWPAGEPLEIKLDLNSGHRLTWLRVHYGMSEAYEAPEAVIEAADKEGNFSEIGKVPGQDGTAQGTYAPVVELNTEDEHQLLRLRYPALKKMLWIKEIEIHGQDGAVLRAAQRFDLLSAQDAPPDLDLLGQLTIALRVRRMLGHDKTLQERALDLLAEATAVTSGVRAGLEVPPDAPAAGSVIAQVAVTNSGPEAFRDANVKLKLPPGWSAAPSKFDFSVPPGQTVRLPVTLIRASEGRVTLLTSGLLGEASLFMSKQQ